MLANKRTRWLAAGAAAVVLAAAGGATVAMSGALDDDQPLTGETLRRATQAALAHTGGGTVIETEAGDDGATYGVEVRLVDGRVVEVNLNSAFNVVGQELDDDGPGDEDDE